MKQIIQSLRTGETFLDVIRLPATGVKDILIKTTFILLSPGTERMLLSFGNAGIVSKVRQQPEKVRQVIDKINTDGLIPTLETVYRKLVLLNFEWVR